MVSRVEHIILQLRKHLLFSQLFGLLKHKLVILRPQYQIVGVRGIHRVSFCDGYELFEIVRIFMLGADVVVTSLF